MVLGVVMAGVTAGAQEPAPTSAAVIEDDPDEVVLRDRPLVLPGAAELLARVRAALPGEPLRIEARLVTRSRDGDVLGELNAKLLVDWRPGTPHAEFLIRDAFGADLERMRIQYGPDGASSFTYLRGDPPEEARPPDLNTAIQETDITWADLSLAFLWWPGGKTTGAEKVKGRLCFTVDIPAPNPEESGLGTVRLWVDPEANVLLRVAGYNRAGEHIRQLDVKSLKRIEDLWVIKDLVVLSYPSRRKTLLRVHSVEPAEQR
jgi:hypothetical protein